MKTRRSTLFVVPALCVATLWGGALPSHAVTLEQKWQKGAQYTYDFVMQGDATVLTDAPQFPLANVPIPIKLKGNGQILFDTKDVDANGAGSVVPTFAPFTLYADAFGQKIEAQLKTDKTQVIWNGRQAWAGDALPPTTLRISREGKLLGVILPDIPAATRPLPNGAPRPAGAARPNAAGATTAPAPAPAPNGQTGVAQPNGVAKSAVPTAVLGAIQSIITQAFPAVWPGRDVNEGDTWSATIIPPNISAKAGQVPTVTPPTADTKPLGKFDFKLGPEEQIGGRAARRISVVGALSYTGDKTATANANPNAAPQGQLQSVSQKVSGNLWFDPALGQIVRAEMDVQSGIKGTASAGGKAALSSGSFDFTGTLQMQLKTTTPEAGA